MSKAIARVAVCGAAGTMGAGIAIVAARAGFRTICYDVAKEGLDRALKQTEGFLRQIGRARQDDGRRQRRGAGTPDMHDIAR